MPVLLAVSRHRLIRNEEHRARTHARNRESACRSDAVTGDAGPSGDLVKRFARLDAIYPAWLCRDGQHLPDVQEIGVT